jgi:hypothetical protein
MVRRDTDGTVVLVRGDAEVASWPCAGRGRPDLSTIDALARLQLLARRLGFSIVVRDASPALAELVELSGLAGVLPLEVSGQAEFGEQVGVEEVVHPGDPVA